MEESVFVWAHDKRAIVDLRGTAAEIVGDEVIVRREGRTYTLYKGVLCKAWLHQLGARLGAIQFEQRQPAP